jgi:hypothetical protein
MILFSYWLIDLYNSTVKGRQPFNCAVRQISMCAGTPDRVETDQVLHPNFNDEP